MSRTVRNKDNFLVQGSILAIASILSRIIGLLYRIPLVNILGDNGNDYYGQAMEIYSTLLIISSYSLPLAVSKLVSARMAVGQRKNAYRIFKGAMVFAIFSGTAAGLVVFFGASFITTYLIRTPLSIFALWVLAPTLLLVAVLGVIRGFFQGLGTMMPSAFSQLMEQLVNALVSIWAAYVLFSYGTRIGDVLGGDEKYAQAYAAAGGTIGTGAGAAVALIFVLFVYMVYKPLFKRSMKRDRGAYVESYGKIFRVLIFTIVPVILSTTIYNISATLDSGIFKNIAAIQGVENYGTMWGIFTGKCRTLTNVPIAIASALAASSVPSIANAFSAKDIRLVREKIRSSIHFVMVIVFPCAVGIGVLASPILSFLFHDERALSAGILQLGAVSIVFTALSTLTNGILQGINRMKIPIINATIALILHTGVLVVLMYVFHIHIYAVLIANIFFALIMCILNVRAIKKYVKYRQEIKRTFLIPAVAAGVMGGAAAGCYKLGMLLLKNNGIVTLLSIIAGAVIYGILMLLLKGIREEELRGFPKGAALVRIAKKAHLLH